MNKREFISRAALCAAAGLWMFTARAADTTAAIQAQLDAAWRKGGGEVIVEPGEHRLGSVRLRSGVTLRLKSGARIVGSTEIGDYLGVLQKDTVEPVDAKALRTSAEDLTRRAQCALFCAYGAHDIRVIGEPGSVIDGVNCYDPKGAEGYRGPHTFSFVASTNVMFSGVTVVHSADYAIKTLLCRNVRISGVTVKGGHDGIHFDLCDDVRIADSTLTTGDDSVAGSGCSDIVVTNCFLSSACSPFRLGGRNVLVVDCRVKGPCDYPHRWTLTPEEKAARVTSSASGRRTTGAFYQGYTGDVAHRNFTPGNIVVRNVKVEGVERFLVSLSGLPGALWQDGRGITDITFENVTATGLGLPAAVVAKANEPLKLTLRNCSFSFRSHQKSAFFGRNVTVVNEGVRLANADRLYEQRSDVSYDDVPEFPSWRIESNAQRAKWKLPPLTADCGRERVSSASLAYTRTALWPGFDGKYCKMCPSVATDGKGLAFMTYGMLLLTGSDVFCGSYLSKSTDGGVTWSKPRAVTEFPDTREHGLRVTRSCNPCYNRKHDRWFGLGSAATYENDRVPYLKVVDGRPYGWPLSAKFDPRTGKFSDAVKIDFPLPYARVYPFGQMVELEDGEMLVPFNWEPLDKAQNKDDGYSVFGRIVIARCRVGGAGFEIVATGKPIACDGLRRGVGEPSLIRLGKKFYLTLRSDEAGMWCSSDDGLNFSAPKRWAWTDDGKEIGNRNTQQHWMKVGGKLYLAYTRVTPTNGHVFRNRAPIFLAEFDPLRGGLIRETEIPVVPERGARLGNFCCIEDGHGGSWLVTAEWMQPIGCEKYGSDNSIWLVKATEKGHVFSMSCKVTSLNGVLATAEGRAKAIAWWRKNHFSAFWLESYRHGERVATPRLVELREAFRAAGFETRGLVTPTMLNDPGADGKVPMVVCWSDPKARSRLRAECLRAAGVFETVILDDFLFSSCGEGCARCKADKARRGIADWGAYRRALLYEVCEKDILGPVRAAHPKAKLIIKYPCWYKNYARNGYDPERQNDLFGACWIGTETRDANPEPLQACWIMDWMDRLSRGRCGGGWYDGLDSTPEKFVEQAYYTILGGARESLVHCYDYLLAEDPGKTPFGEKVRRAGACAKAFAREADRLKKLGDFLVGAERLGFEMGKNGVSRHRFRKDGREYTARLNTTDRALEGLPPHGFNFALDR